MDALLRVGMHPVSAGTQFSPSYRQCLGPDLEGNTYYRKCDSCCGATVGLYIVANSYSKHNPEALGVLSK